MQAWHLSGKAGGLGDGWAVHGKTGHWPPGTQAVEFLGSKRRLMLLPDGTDRWTGPFSGGDAALQKPARRCCPPARRPNPALSNPIEC